MFKKMLFAFLCLTFPLWAEVENSILPLMQQLEIKGLKGKVNCQQLQTLTNALCHRTESLKVMSFNMLFNIPLSENKLELENQWPNRASRLIEYFGWAKSDIVGSQELQKEQLYILMDAFGDEYGYYGMGVQDGCESGDIPAIFYRKERLELLEGHTYYFSETPCEVSRGPFGAKNTYTVCIFKDLLTQCVFEVVNTHLAFSNVERRHYEATKLKKYLKRESKKMPLIVTGDFNTFPFRQGLSVPFFDGDQVVALIEEGGVKDSEKLALFGHFGPISSTNFNAAEKKSFSSLGTPGVILDHVFVNKCVKILSHGIDPATVNGYWPSDHFPVIVELELLK